jgi:hypothetical protein
MPGRCVCDATCAAGPAIARSAADPGSARAAGSACPAGARNGATSAWIPGAAGDATGWGTWARKSSPPPILRPAGTNPSCRRSGRSSRTGPPGRDRVRGVRSGGRPPREFTQTSGSSTGPVRNEGMRKTPAGSVRLLALPQPVDVADSHFETLDRPFLSFRALAPGRGRVLLRPESRARRGRPRPGRRIQRPAEEPPELDPVEGLPQEEPPSH